MKESTRHVSANPLEPQYREPGPENVVGAIGSVGAGRWEETTFTPSVMPSLPSVMKRRQEVRYDGFGPGGLHAGGHAGTDAARPVLSAQANT